MHYPITQFFIKSAYLMKVMFRQSEIKRFWINLTSPVMMKGYEGWNFVCSFWKLAPKAICLIDNKLYMLSVMQTLDFVSGLHNCLEFSRPLSCLNRLCKHGKRFLLLKYLDVYTRCIYSLLPIDILAYGDIIKSYFLKTFITDELGTRLDIHIYIFIN